MGILFKKREKAADQIGIQLIGSAKLNASIRKVQSAWAEWLRKWTASFSLTQWKIVLGLFILLAGGFNLLLITGSFRSADPWELSISTILKPQYMTQTGDVFSNQKSEDLEKELLWIVNQSRVLDSLKKSEVRKSKLDSTALDLDGLDSILKQTLPEK